MIGHEESLEGQGRLLTRHHKMPSQDWLERKMRETYPVGARPGKRRISRKEKDKKQRYDQALQWQRDNKGEEQLNEGSAASITQWFAIRGLLVAY